MHPHASNLLLLKLWAEEEAFINNDWKSIECIPVLVILSGLAIRR